MSHLSSCLPFQVLLLGHALKIKAEREYFLSHIALNLSTSTSHVLPVPSLPEELVNGWMGLLIRLAHSLRLSLCLPCSAPPLGSLLQTLLG